VEIGNERKRIKVEDSLLKNKPFARHVEGVKGKKGIHVRGRGKKKVALKVFLFCDLAGEVKKKKERGGKKDLSQQTHRFLPW